MDDAVITKRMSTLLFRAAHFRLLFLLLPALRLKVYGCEPRTPATLDIILPQYVLAKSRLITMVFRIKIQTRPTIVAYKVVVRLYRVCGCFGPRCPGVRWSLPATVIADFFRFAAVDADIGIIVIRCVGRFY